MFFNNIPGEIIFFELFFKLLTFKILLIFTIPIIPGLKIFGLPTRLITVDSIPIFELPPFNNYL